MYSLALFPFPHLYFEFNSPEVKSQHEGKSTGQQQKVKVMAVQNFKPVLGFGDFRSMN